jgi:hypothetical protein
LKIAEELKSAANITSTDGSVGRVDRNLTTGRRFHYTPPVALLTDTDDEEDDVSC